ncbi:hypothetical protein P8452_55366 [Trifolium repens]|nr:hypothetical protein P8452_55366 [Trifolium repens]
MGKIIGNFGGEPEKKRTPPDPPLLEKTSSEWESFVCIRRLCYLSQLQTKAIRDLLPRLTSHLFDVVIRCSFFRNSPIALSTQKFSLVLCHEPRNSHAHHHRNAPSPSHDHITNAKVRPVVESGYETLLLVIFCLKQEFLPSENLCCTAD